MYHYGKWFCNARLLYNCRERKKERGEIELKYLIANQEESSNMRDH